jgi:hypothetical protein
MNFKTILIIIVTAIIIIGCGKSNETAEQASDMTKTPEEDLFTAVLTDNLEVIKQHIEAGSDLDVKEPSRGSTPLITAAVFGKTEAAKLLIDGGADLNYQNMDGSTALHSAAFLCNTEIVEGLITKGIVKSIKNNFGQTAYQSVEAPFEDVNNFYDGMKAALSPLGLNLDYEHIKITRPKIAEMLKE